MSNMTEIYDGVLVKNDGHEITYGDVVTLVNYMAERGIPSENIAYAVEKPWKFVEEIMEAKEAARNEE